MCCGYQRNICNSKKVAALQSKVARQIGEFMVYGVVVSEIPFISFHVFDFTAIPTALVARKMLLSIMLSVVFEPTCA